MAENESDFETLLNESSLGTQGARQLRRRPHPDAVTRTRKIANSSDGEVGTPSSRPRYEFARLIPLGDVPPPRLAGTEYALVGAGARVDVDDFGDSIAGRAAGLLMSYRNDGKSAFGELISLVTPLLWHVCRSERLDAESVEEVVLGTWQALVQNSDSLADPRGALQWLLVTARRESWRIQRHREGLGLSDLDEIPLEASADAGRERTVDRVGNDAVLARRFAALPERCQALLRAVAYVERSDFASVASALRMPMGSIGSTRGRCLARLRRQLASEYQWSEVFPQTSSDIDDEPDAAIDSADLQILSGVARMFDHLDPMPDQLIDRAKFSVTLDALYGNLHELQAPGPRPDRAAPDMKTITFTTSNLTMLVTIHGVSADLASVEGWIAPGDGLTVEIRTGKGVRRVMTDQDGRFDFGETSRGQVQFVVTPHAEGDDRSSVLTPSIDI